MIIRKVEPKRYLGLRIASALIDYSKYFIIIYVYVKMLGTSNDDGVYTVTDYLAFPPILFWFIYFVVLEGTNQATPGHDILKLVVVRTKGDRIGLTDALKRRIVDIIDITFYGIPALICICNTPKFQRIGDLWADAVVVKRSDIIETDVTFKSLS